MQRQLLRTLLQILFALSVLAFLALFVQKNWDRLSEVDLTFRVGPVIPASLLLVSFYLLYSRTWQWLLRQLDGARQVDTLSLLRIFFFSFIVRYLPAGKLWNVGTRIELYRRETGRRGPAAASLYFEQVYFVGGAVVLMLASTAVRPPGPLTSAGAWLRPASAAGTVLLVAVLLATPSQLLLSVGRLFRSKALTDHHLVLSRRARALAFVRFLLINTAQGAAAWFILLALYPPLANRPDLLPLVLAAYPFSRFLGQLATVVPGGLGVREGAFTLLLSGSIPVPITLAAGAILRLLAVVIELGFLGVLAVMTRRTREEGES